MKKGLIFIVFSILMYSTYADQPSIQNHHVGYVSFGAHAQAWQVSFSTEEDYDDPINQVSLPFELQFPVSDRLTFKISNKPHFSWWRQSQSVQGLSDTWIQSYYFSKNERWMFHLGVGLPTGKTKLDSTQYLLSSREGLAHQGYQYVLPVVGQGTRAQAGFNVAIPIKKKAIIGIGAQYILEGKMTPMDYRYGDEFGLDHLWNVNYKPGDELDFIAGVDIPLSETMKLSMDMIYAYYFSDYLNDDKIFDSGDRILGKIKFFGKLDSDRYYYFILKYRHKSKNFSWETNSVLDDLLITQGDEAGLDVVINATNFRNGGLLVIGNSRYTASNTDNYDMSLLNGFGLGVYFSPARKIMINGHLKYFIGTLDDEVTRRVNAIELHSYFTYYF